MTIITATPQPDNGAMALSIAATETIEAITRTDANGVADVRTLPGVLPYTPTLVEYRRNYATNPRPNGITGWSMTSNTGSGTWSTQSGTGFSYNRMTKDAQASTVGIYFYPTATPFAEGTKVWATVQVRVSAAVLVQFRNTSTVIAGASYNLLADTWTTITLDNHAVIGAAGFRMSLLVNSLPAGATVDARFVGVFDKPGPWFSGVGDDFNGAQDPAYAYAWAGVLGNSESTQSLPQQPLVLSDYEAASGAVSYTAGTATQAATWDIGSPWLFVPVMPAYSVRVQALLEYSAGGQSLGTIHELLGREDPVAVLRGMSTRRGSIKLYCGTFAEAIKVVEATKRGEVLMLRQPEHQGMDMYFTATSYGIPTLETRGAATVFGVDIGYAELARPIGDLAGSLGWTFAALAGAYPKFATVAKKYATFQDLLLNATK